MARNVVTESINETLGIIQDAAYAKFPGVKIPTEISEATSNNNGMAPMCTYECNPNKDGRGFGYKTFN